MTRNPPGLQELTDRIEKQIGPFNLGVVGDEYHTYGYHLGGYEVPRGDYSTVLARDRAGITRFGGYWAAAVDIGMGWPASRAWFRWLIDGCKAGRFPDVREVIGSFDGKSCVIWDAIEGGPHKVPFTPGDLSDHRQHSHVSLYRDAVFRSQVALIGAWTATGLRPSSPVTKPGVRPSPSLSGAPTGLPPETAGHGWAAGLGTTAALLGAAGLAWIIHRRNQLGG